MNNLLSKFGVILSVFVMLMTTGGVVSARERQLEKKIINIGIYAPFTSKSAYIGRNMLGAMEIASEQLKSSEISYEFFTLDVLPNKEKAASTLQKFIEAHQLDVLVTEGSDMGKLVTPIAKKNNLIHFCIGTNKVIADGKNTFQVHSPNHQRGAILPMAVKPEFFAQFKQEYFSHPVTEAGYAYDIFQVFHHSVVLAMKTNDHFSTQDIATNLVTLQPGTGLMGAYSLDKKGVSYKRTTLTA